MTRRKKSPDKRGSRRRPKSARAAGAVETRSVAIRRTKGRPMITWVGKRPLSRIIGFPAQLIEIFSPLGATENQKAAYWSDWPKSYPKNGLLFHGDNKDVLANLLINGYRGKVNLIYIDPPFNTGVDYVRRVVPRGLRTEEIQGEEYSFAEQVQYAANWHLDVYLQSLYDRLQLAKELLASDGFIFIRMDVHYGPYLRLMADEVFGPESFQNEIVVNRVKKNVTDKGRRTIPNAVDSLFVYSNGPKSEYKNIKSPLPELRPGYWHSMESAEISGPRQVVIDGMTYYPTPGTHFKFPQDQADAMLAEQPRRIRVNPSTNKPEYWVPEKAYETLDSNWTDIPGYTFTTGYPTENAEKLLERVIETARRSLTML